MYLKITEHDAGIIIKNEKDAKEYDNKWTDVVMIFKK